MSKSENFVPFECPVCLTLFRDAADTLSYFSRGCCRECGDEYLFPNGLSTAHGVKIPNKIKRDLRKKRQSLPSYILK